MHCEYSLATVQWQYLKGTGQDGSMELAQTSAPLSQTAGHCSALADSINTQQTRAKHLVHAHSTGQESCINN